MKNQKRLKILTVKEVVTDHVSAKYRGVDKCKNILFEDVQSGLTCMKAIWNDNAQYDEWVVGTQLKIPGEIIDFHGHRMVKLDGEKLLDAFKSSDIRELAPERVRFLHLEASRSS